MQIRDDAALSMLIHAMSKTGKSTFSSTAPVPLLVLDAEGSWRFITERGYQSGIPLRSRTWDPLTDVQPPRWDGTWDVCRVKVHDWPTLVQVHSSLRMYEHDFISLVMDSLSEVQRKCKKNIATGGQLQQQDWGKLLDSMGDMVRDFRDMTENPRNAIRVAVFIAETRETNGCYGPYVQGQLATQIPYMFDIAGYLFVQPTADEHLGTTQDMRRLLIGPPQEKFVVGERVQGRLGYVVDNPSIIDMVNRVFPYTPGDDPSFTS